MRTKFNKYNFLLYLIWPLIALVSAFIKREYNFLKIFLPIFTGILGYTYQPTSGADVNRPIEKFKMLNNVGFFRKLEYLLVNKLLNLLDEGIELYIDVVAFITSIFTDNPKWLLFIFGYVYGLVLYNFYKALTQNNAKFSSLFSKILLFFVVLLIQPSMALNGRFWLATLLFYYFVLAYYNNPKLKFVLFSLLCIFIHKAFIAAFILFLIWYLTSNIKFKKYIYFTILLLSIITPSSFMLERVRQGNDAFGEAYNKQAEGYTREEYIENTSKVSESRSAIFNIYSQKNILLFYASAFFLAYVYFKKYHRLNASLLSMFYLVILFICFSNFFIGVPSLGSRYRFIASGLMLLFFYKVMQYQNLSMYKPPSVVLLGSLIFSFLVSLRMEFEQLYGFIYIFNPILNYIVVPDVSVMEIIK